MKPLARLSLLCLTGLFLYARAQGQSITTDKPVYGVKDNITVNFSYGKEKDYSAFVSVRPIKNGGSQFDSNAYDQPTGKKIIDPRFPPGEYEAVLVYTNPRRVIARTTFKVVGSGGEWRDETNDFTSRGPR